MKEIEVCSNDEWLFWCGPFSGAPESLEDIAHELCEQWYIAVWTRLIDAGYSPILPNGQRTFCHGWHGFQAFTRKGCGLGTFDDLTDEEWDTITEMATDEADELIDIQPLEEVS